MKKFLSVSALVVAVTSVFFISYGSASRYRPTTNRLFTYNYRNHLRRKVVKPVTEMDKFRFWYNFQQQKTRKYDRRSYGDWRSAHDNLFPRDENLHQKEKLVVRNDDARSVDLMKKLPQKKIGGWVMPVEGIKLELPKGVYKNQDGQYVDHRSDLAFEVNKFESKCTTLGFQMCAVQRTKHLQSRRSLKAISNVKREFSLRRMAVAGRFVYVPQFTETFEVNDFGIDRMYSIHTIKNPMTDEVYYVEGWTSTHNAGRAKNILKAVARTIRFN